MSYLQKKSLMENFIFLCSDHYFTHFKELSSPILNFLKFFDRNGTPTQPLKIVKNVPVVIVYNFQKKKEW